MSRSALRFKSSLMRFACSSCSCRLLTCLSNSSLSAARCTSAFCALPSAAAAAPPSPWPSSAGGFGGIICRRYCSISLPNRNRREIASVIDCTTSNGMLPRSTSGATDCRNWPRAVISSVTFFWSSTASGSTVELVSMSTLNDRWMSFLSVLSTASQVTVSFDCSTICLYCCAACWSPRIAACLTCAAVATSCCACCCVRYGRPVISAH